MNQITPHTRAHKKMLPKIKPLWPKIQFRIGKPLYALSYSNYNRYANYDKYDPQLSLIKEGLHNQCFYNY